MYVSLKDKWVVTRKRHRCWGCCRIFPAGTKLRYWAGVTDGDFGAGYWCPSCHALYWKHVVDRMLAGDTLIGGWAWEYGDEYLAICQKLNDEDGMAIARQCGASPERLKGV